MPTAPHHSTPAQPHRADMTAVLARQMATPGVTSKRAPREFRLPLFVRPVNR